MKEVPYSCLLLGNWHLGKASFVKVQMEVESFRSRVTSIIAFCRLQALKICHYIVSL